MNNRIYNDKVDINNDNIREFYNKRAQKFVKGKKNQYTSVLLGDNNPEYAKKWDEFEKNYIGKYLNSGTDKRFLDIGCGIGRWAENVIDKCGQYVGTDFSIEMVKVARERFKEHSNVQFINSSFQDIFNNESITKNKFDTIIITGVSMYINDSDLRKCYSSLKNILNDGAVVYIEESVGVKERLTLNHIWSDSLDDNYDAIYRTREEYLDLMSSLTDDLHIVEEGYFEQLDKKELSETSHWYIILNKK